MSQTDLEPASEAAPPTVEEHARWKFIRDVLVFEMKLALNNVHNFFQIPATIGVALFDLCFRHGEEGSRFYWLVEKGRLIDDSIDIYSIIDHRERGLNKDYTVDAVVKRLESVIVREYEKGGTAASVKNALDRAIDEMQAKTAPGTEKAADALKRAAERLRPSKEDAERAAESVKRAAERMRMSKSGDQ